MMVASLSGVLKTIFWIFIISGIIRLVVRYTANYAVSKVNEEVNRNQKREADTHAKRKTTSGNKTPASEYVDFIEIKDQE